MIVLKCMHMEYRWCTTNFSAQRQLGHMSLNLKWPTFFRFTVVEILSKYQPTPPFPTHNIKKLLTRIWKKRIFVKFWGFFCNFSCAGVAKIKKTGFTFCKGENSMPYEGNVRLKHIQNTLLAFH